jgi:hypothetical protein
MNIETLLESKAGDNGLLALGYALGQSHTFGLVAGRSLAAQAQGIRMLREQKQYKQCCERWEDFCPKYLNMSRVEADRIIGRLEEFGPAYFEVSQVTRISAETYRAIAPAVSDGVLHHNGEAIPIDAENSRRVAKAIAEIRSALPKKSAAELSELAREVKDISREPDLQRRIHHLAERCIAIVAELDKIGRDERLGLTRNCLRSEVARVREEILRVAA